MEVLTTTFETLGIWWTFFVAVLLAECRHYAGLVFVAEARDRVDVAMVYLGGFFLRLLFFDALGATASTTFTLEM